MEIKIFGETAKQIKEGQKFIASVGSVEGRTVVTLRTLNEYERRGYFGY